ncbi:glycoside hydrolase [Echria macrotheca]|uniref:lytic cellulose monooxygenase (C4-dehydrogenating) n=1 Tax=Echria macrotheca TaxID=438768 RepID=A0AAJ0B396_9PEZI|nr:glycoside hydrolase [Echria macrotheca]
MRSLIIWSLLAAMVHGHYKFPRLVLNGQAEPSDWVSVRKTKVTNSRDNGGISDVNSPDMRCFQGNTGKATATVAAGDSIGFVASAGIMHFGPCQFYMARVPDDKDINTWDPAGNVWFKVGSISAVQNGGPLSGNEATWPAYHKTQVSTTIPKNLPSGKYLIRVESIALHLAQAPGGAQFYISCGQVEVTNGGSGTPGPLVAFPGAYKANDPGLIWPNSPPPKTYTAPGPEVWTG